MLEFVCETCETHYEAQITNSRIIYLDGSKRLDLKNETDVCESCAAELQKELSSVMTQAKARLRERKKNV